MPDRGKNSQGIVDRRLSVALIVATLIASWLGMQWVHEAGHVLAAWVTGGSVQRVVLHPLSISRTDLDLNPRPLFTTWGGPTFGVLVPVAAWITARSLRLNSAFLLQFFAGFCCVANGAYIGFGSFDAVGDCGELLKHGAQPWQLWTFGVVAGAAGFLVWNRLGSRFGIGRHPAAVSKSQVVIVAAIGASLAAVGLLWG